MTSVHIHSFRLSCSYKGGTITLTPGMRRVFEEAAEDVGAQHSVVTKVQNPDSFMVYSDEGILLYIMHPRDVFVTKIRLLEDARVSKNVRVRLDTPRPLVTPFNPLPPSIQPASLECVRELIAHLPHWLDSKD